jgi:hypothetical protein
LSLSLRYVTERMCIGRVMNKMQKTLPKQIKVLTFRKRLPRTLRVLAMTNTTNSYTRNRSIKVVPVDLFE